MIGQTIHGLQWLVPSPVIIDALDILASDWPMCLISGLWLVTGQHRLFWQGLDWHLPEPPSNLYITLDTEFCLKLSVNSIISDLLILSQICPPLKLMRGNSLGWLTIPKKKMQYTHIFNFIKSWKMCFETFCRLKARLSVKIYIREWDQCPVCLDTDTRGHPIRGRG